ncbi:hypothetical protein F5883DRAFT_698610 [Diaporthe sp. PMI_573]|nr:hypothetical protein F5883DRAFT_698610 [Diaporthaceae sp. PMI_573]
MNGMPTPPNEDHNSNTHAHPPSPSVDTHQHSIADGWHKRVWKACERCRMKKTKCDREFPCKRCKDYGLVCTAGIRKKTEHKQLPRGYVELLENTQFALIATVHKLYAMVRNQQSWDLGEPELNDRGQPVVHNIASKLGCIRPNADVDLRVQSVFPEDRASLGELVRQLEEQQKQSDATERKHESESGSNRASSSELGHSDFEQDCRESVFGNTTEQMSSQGLTPLAHNFPGQWPTKLTSYPNCMSRPTSMDFGSQAFMDMGMVNFRNLFRE